jgi:hypothetical protein
MIRLPLTEIEARVLLSLLNTKGSKIVDAITNRLEAMLNSNAALPEMDPLNAINWAADNRRDTFGFLNDWKEGDLSHWSDYVAWAEDQERK